MATPKPAKPAPLSEFAPMCDELGSLEKEMAPYAQKLARIEQLRKSLRAACTAHPDSPWTVEGVHFTAVLGSCANVRGFDVAALVKKIGAKAFAVFASCTLKALEENVSPEICAAVISSKPVGPRSLKTFEKGAGA